MKIGALIWGEHQHTDKRIIGVRKGTEHLDVFKTLGEIASPGSHVELTLVFAGAHVVGERGLG